MEIVGIFAFVLIIFVLVIGIIVTVIRKRLKETWRGRITDKKVEVETQRGEDFDRNVDVYYLYVKLTDGSSKKISVGKKLYERLSVGDTVEKQAGTYDPVKV